MTRRTAAILAWGSCSISVVFVALSIVVTAGNAAVGLTPFGSDIALSVPATAGLGLVLLSFSLVGAVIAVRRPDNGVGWLFCANGLADSFFNLAGSLEAHGLVTNPGTIPGAAWFGLASDALWLPFIAMTTMFLFLLFPEGRPVGTGRRVAVRAGVIAVVVATIGGLLEPHLYGLAVANPITFRLSSSASGALIVPGYVVMLAVLLWSVWDLLRRLRRSTGEARLQLRWFVCAALLVLVVFIPSTLVPSVAFWWQVSGALALISLPVAVGIAILKYRLYDIDVVINKTVVYVTLAAFITLVYVAIVVGLGGLIGAANESLGLSIVATAIVAVAFQPVRERVQRFANRFVYGERATPYEVLARFSERVAGTYATEDVLPRTARVIAEGTGAERAEVWLRIGEELVLSAAWPADGENLRAVALETGELPPLDGADRSVPVRYHEELLGAVTVTKAPGATSPPPRTGCCRTSPARPASSCRTSG